MDLTANQEILDDSVVAVLATIATLSVVFRFIVKIRQPVGLQGDDWFILMALIGEYGTAACTLTGNYFGAGRHVWATDAASLRKMSIALFIYPWIYVIATVGLKISFCWTYMRIFNLGTVRSTMKCRTWFDRSLTACVFASLLYALSVWLPMTVACRPLRHFWDQYTGVSNGKCLDYLSMWIITGIFSAALDLVILLLPIPRIWSLQMPRVKRLGVICVLALGTLVVIAAIIRLVYMSRMIHAIDITWALGPAQIWTSLEPSLGIVSSCLIVTFRSIVSGIRTILGVKRDGKVDRLSTHDGNNVRYTAPRKVSRFRLTGIEEDEEELRPYPGKGEYRAIITTKTLQQGAQEFPQESPWQPSQQPVLDNRIQVETSFVVNGTSTRKMSIAHP